MCRVISAEYAADAVHVQRDDSFSWCVYSAMCFESIAASFMRSSERCRANIADSASDNTACIQCCSTVEAVANGCHCYCCSVYYQ
jgi:hypothetical protein